MEINKEQVIGQVVASDYRTASVFKSFEIDFCCNGHRTIAEACEKQGLDPQRVILQLDEIRQQADHSATDYQSWPCDLLADYIEKKHHRYVETKTPEIKAYLEKICSVHGRQHPELFEINTLFNEAAGELAQHMKKEEFILFPFVRKMMKARQEGVKMQVPHFGTVENPVAMMKHEHDTEGERFRKIAALSRNYTPPADACATYTVAFNMLKEFENDLHLHIHLENNILFPKAIDMEKELA